MNNALRLTKVEIGAAAWQKVIAHVDERLTHLRAICENPNKSESERLAAAVRVSELKKLLELAQPAPQQAPQPVE